MLRVGMKLEAKISKNIANSSLKLCWKFGNFVVFYAAAHEDDALMDDDACEHQNIIIIADKNMIRHKSVLTMDLFMSHRFPVQARNVSEKGSWRDCTNRAKTSPKRNRLACEPILQGAMSGPCNAA